MRCDRAWIAVLLASALLARAAVAERLLREGRGRRRPAPAGGLPFRQRLENYEEVQYHGSLQLGGQDIRAIYDTGSFDILVVSTRCSQCRGAVYNPGASPTFHAYGGDVVEHSFGSGPTESALGSEVVRIGPLVAQNQTIHEILKHNMSVLEGASFDAIVGIGPEGDGAKPGPGSLLQNLGISEYSICLGRTPGSPGWLTWGGGVTAAQKASSAALRVVGRHHWAVSMRNLLPDVELRGERREAAGTLLCARGCAAILDSGTSLIAGPSHSLQGLSYLLPELREDCSNFGDLPDLEFELSGRRLRLPPEAYVFRLRGTAQEQRAAGKLLLSQVPDAAGEDTCVLGFLPMDRHTDYGPLWVLGMPFFRQFHVTFGLAENVSERRIWLSGASSSCGALPLEAEDVGTKNSTYEGAGVYPRMIVAQRGQSHRQSAPRVIRAASLLRPRVPGGL